MYDFTQRKFALLSSESQHKKCAEFIRCLYEKKLQGRLEEFEQGIEIYNQLLSWMKLPSFPAATLNTLSDRYHWHNQLAGIKKKEHHLLPSVRKGDRLEGEELWPIDIYLDHVRSAHNVGSILRSVEAFALGTVYFSDQTPFSDHKQVQDAAMGTHQWVICHREIELSALKKPIIALETSEKAIPLYDFLFPASFTLVVGNEEYGCSDLTLAQADYLVEIPLRGRKNSLNVANAFAIAAGEIQRQKRFKHW